MEDVELRVTDTFLDCRTPNQYVLDLSLQVFSVPSILSKDKLHNWGHMLISNRHTILVGSDIKEFNIKCQGQRFFCGPKFPYLLELVVVCILQPTGATSS